MSKKGILSGVRVVDLTRMLSGPYATMVLADHGAEVIKIEDDKGDSSRFNGPYVDSDKDQKWAGYFISLNRNKKSVQLNLKTSKGREEFLGLIRTADILVENFRPGVMEKLGVSYEVLRGINPKIVYGAVRGFGDPRSGKSPYMSWPSYDVVAQAMGGVINLTGQDSENVTKVGPGIGDIFSGLFLSFGIIAALRNAEATGVGQFVDIAMYDAMISLCERAVYQYDIEGKTPSASGNGHPFLAPFGVFPATDGKVAIGVVEDRFWVSLVNAIGSTEYSKDPKFATLMARKENIRLVNETVAAWTSKFSKSELLKKLGGVVPFGPVNNVKDIINDQHTQARKMITRIPNPDDDSQSWLVASNPLNFDQTPKLELKPPPRLGEHNKLYLSSGNEKKVSPDFKQELRKAFGTFTTGVTIVTAKQSNGVPRGFTANSFTSVSLEPPLLLVCLSKKALSYQTFMNTDYFGINVLSQKQESISVLFATQSDKKFDSNAWKNGEKNVPVFDEALSTFVCAKERLVDAGDHTILIGRILHFSVKDGKPLVYSGGRYQSI